jgi:uncharacterized RDD family membrane protein YckC
VTQHPPGQPRDNHSALPYHSPYTSWFQRVAAAVIDWLIPAGIAVFGLVTAVSMGQLGALKCPEPSNPLQRLGPHGDNEFPWNCHLTWTNWGAAIVIALAWLLALMFGLWNLYRQGKTGSTIGKSVLKFKVVGAKSGQPIGIIVSIVRQVAHTVDVAFCFIGYLMPLWTQKRQTLADIVVATVCVPIDAGATPD